jgi:hypothetical protein
MATSQFSVMLKPIQTTFLCFSTASCVCILTPSAGFPGTAKEVLPAQITPAAGQQQSELRTVFFPKDCCIGSLLLEGGGQQKQVAGAIGKVTVRVPKQYFLTFEANRKVVENPKILESVDAPGVDCVKLRITSFDQKEDGRCDEALSHISHFTGMTILDLDHSDASDAGIAHLPPLKHLRNISCRGSMVSSSSFKTLSKFPTIKDIDLAECVIKSADLKYLADLSNLERLNLSQTRMTSDDMKYLSKLSSLKGLVIGRNPGINNDGLKYLAPLTKLGVLVLSYTKVTAEGLTQLRGLPLTSVDITSVNSAQKVSLKKTFPHAFIGGSIPPSVSSQEAAIFAPLK